MYFLIKILVIVLYVTEGRKKGRSASRYPLRLSGGEKKLASQMGSMTGASGVPRSGHENVSNTTTYNGTAHSNSTQNRRKHHRKSRKHSTMTNFTGSFTVGVCLTGQTQRLELLSKIKNVFEYGKRINGTYDLVLALQNDSQVNFVNEGTVHRIMEGSTREKRDISEHELNIDLSKKFEVPTMNYLGTHLRPFVRHLAFNIAQTDNNSVLNEDYISRLDKGKRGIDWETRRARGHMNQFFHLRRCYDSFIELEAAHGFKYDFFVRLREDTYIAKGLDPRIIKQTVKKTKNEKAIVTPLCESWGSTRINDKGAIITRAAAYGFFIGPLDHFTMFWQETKLPKSRLGPEAFLWHVYSENMGIAILRSTKLMPLFASMPRPHTMTVHTDAKRKDICLRMRLTTNSYNGGWRCYAHELSSFYGKEIHPMICEDEIMSCNKVFRNYQKGGNRSSGNDFHPYGCDPRMNMSEIAKHMVLYKREEDIVEKEEKTYFGNIPQIALGDWDEHVVPRTFDESRIKAEDDDLHLQRVESDDDVARRVVELKN